MKLFCKEYWEPYDEPANIFREVVSMNKAIRETIGAALFYILEACAAPQVEQQPRTENKFCPGEVITVDSLVNFAASYTSPPGPDLFDPQMIVDGTKYKIWFSDDTMTIYTPGKLTTSGEPTPPESEVLGGETFLRLWRTQHTPSTASLGLHHSLIDGHSLEQLTGNVLNMYCSEGRNIVVKLNERAKDSLSRGETL